MLKIVFLGLCMFVKNAGGTRTVVIPDISAAVNVMTPRGATSVEPHIAYISAAKADVVWCSGCEMRVDEDQQQRQVLHLSGDTVEITGMDENFTEDKDYEKTIPHITKSCPQFRLTIPATATTILLRNGALKANCGGGDTCEKCQKCSTCVGVENCTTCEKCEKCENDAHVCHSVLEGVATKVVAIKVTKSGVERTMVIRRPNDKADIVDVTISNRYAAGFLNRKKNPPLAENHWLAFYTLSTTPVVCDLPAKSGLLETTLACSNSGYP
jgi:hypothetical protein